MQDEMMDLMDVSNEIQETLGRSYNVPDDIDEEELMGGMPQFPILLFLDNLHIFKSCMFQLKLHFSVCCPHSVLLMNAELDALEADMDIESESVPSYLQPDKEPDQESELNLPAAPTGHAAPPNQQQVIVRKFLASVLPFHAHLSILT
jgi:charged multivesicular body protein 5